MLPVIRVVSVWHQMPVIQRETQDCVLDSSRTLRQYAPGTHDAVSGIDRGDVKSYSSLIGLQTRRHSVSLKTTQIRSHPG